MKTAGKIGLVVSTVVVAVVAVAAVLIAYANSIVTELADEAIQERLADMDSAQISYSDLNIDLRRGAISIADFSYTTDTMRYPLLPRVCVSCKQLETDHINWLAVAQDKRLCLKELTADGLSINIESQAEKSDNALEKLQGALRDINIRKVNITNSRFELCKRGTELRVLLPAVEFFAEGLSYDVQKGQLSRCDAMHINLQDGMALTTKDGHTNINIKSCSTNRQGALLAQEICIANNTYEARQIYACTELELAPVQLLDILSKQTLELQYIRLRGGRVSVDKTTTNFHLDMPRVNLSLGQVKYDLQKMQLLYCDSTYTLSLDSLRFRSADGHSLCDIQRITTTDTCIVAQGIIWSQTSTSPSASSESKKTRNLTCRQLQMGRLSPKQMFTTKKLNIPFLTLDNLSVDAILNEHTDNINTGEGQWVEIVENNERISQYREQREEQGKEIMQEVANRTEPFLHNITIDRLTLNGGSLRVQNSSSAYRLHLPHVDGKLFALDYDMQAGEFTCSETHYMLRADAANMLSSDGLYSLQIDHLETADAGALILQGLHGKNTVAKEVFAERKGNVPVTWTETQLSEVRTSKLSFIQKLRSRKIDLDSLYITAELLSIYRDVRYPPKSPYLMPQDILNRFSKQILIHNISLSAPIFEVQLRRDMGGVETLTLRDITMQATNLSNLAGENFQCLLTHRIGSGNSKIRFTLRQDEQASFSVTTDMHDLRGSDFETFLRPMMGVIMDCSISSIVATISGNRDVATGTLCMQYTNLRTQLIKDEVPIPKMQKYAGLINAFAPMFVRKSNPKDSHHEPITAQLLRERDTHKNFATYIITTLLDGMLRTTLSDFAYSKITNSNK